MADQTVAWVLHALEPEDEIEVAHHLPTCPSCRALVREVAATATGLGSAVDQVTPPAGLRDRILDAAARTPQVEPPRSAAGSPVEQRPTDPASTGSRLGSRPGGARTPRRGRRLRDPGRRIGVALVVVAALSGAGIYAARAPACPDTQGTQAPTLADAVARSTGPGTDHAFLTPPGRATAVAAVLVHRSGRQVVTGSLPANDRDQVYVLWGLAPTDAPQALGTFDVGAACPGPQPVGPGDGRGFTEYAISLEHGRSAPSGPSDVVATGEVRP